MSLICFGIDFYIWDDLSGQMLFIASKSTGKFLFETEPASLCFSLELLGGQEKTRNT